MTEPINAPINSGGINRPDFQPHQNPMNQPPRQQQPPMRVNPMAPVTYESGGQQVTIDPMLVRNFLVSGDPSKVSDQEILYFISLCKAQKLNPFVKDAYLIKFGTSPAQVVTSCAALEKRAETFPAYDGMESGIIVKGENGVEYRNGSFYDDDSEKLLGAWAEVYRKDRSRPKHIEVSLKEFNKGNANWNTMPAIMIRKVAKATALREAFPNENGSLYAEEELDRGPAKERAPRKVTQRLTAAEDQK